MAVGFHGLIRSFAQRDRSQGSSREVGLHPPPSLLLWELTAAEKKRSHTDQNRENQRTPAPHEPFPPLARCFALMTSRNPRRLQHDRVHGAFPTLLPLLGECPAGVGSLHMAAPVQQESSDARVTHSNAREIP